MKPSLSKILNNYSFRIRRKEIDSDMKGLKMLDFQLALCTNGNADKRCADIYLIKNGLGTYILEQEKPTLPTKWTPILKKMNNSCINNLFINT